MPSSSPLIVPVLLRIFRTNGVVGRCVLILRVMSCWVPRQTSSYDIPFEYPWLLLRSSRCNRWSISDMLQARSSETPGRAHSWYRSPIAGHESVSLLPDLPNSCPFASLTVMISLPRLLSTSAAPCRRNPRETGEKPHKHDMWSRAERQRFSCEVRRFPEKLE
jgi:hypothetical protein